MKKLLVEAGTIAKVSARVITYHPQIGGVTIYPDSSWTVAFAHKNTTFQADGSMGLDARVLFYFNAGGVTPVMAVTKVGAESDYALACLGENQ